LCTNERQSSKVNEGKRKIDRSYNDDDREEKRERLRREKSGRALLR